MTDHYLRGSHRDKNEPLWHEDKNRNNIIYFDKNKSLNVSEAMDLCGIRDVEIDLAPIEALVEQQRDGETVYKNVAIPNRYALVYPKPFWTNEPVILRRIVGNRYVPMQNKRLAGLLDGLSEHWPVEGTMMLKDGEISVVQLKIAEFFPGNNENERHIAYLTVASDHIQGGLLWLRTDIRVVCWNTYSASIGTLDKLRIPHTDNADTTLEFLAKVEEATVVDQKVHAEQLNQLFVRKIDKDEFADIVEAAFPAPKRSSRMKLAEMDSAKKVNEDLASDFFELVEQDKQAHDWKTERQHNLRAEVGAEFARFNDEFSYAANTAYAGFQAVTNVVNHSDSFTGDKNKQMIATILPTGQKARIQQKAWAACVKTLGQ